MSKSSEKEKHQNQSFVKSQNLELRVKVILNECMIFSVPKNVVSCNRLMLQTLDSSLKVMLLV